MKTASADLSDDEEAMLRAELEGYVPVPVPVPGPGWRPRPPRPRPAPGSGGSSGTSGVREPARAASPGHPRLVRVPHHQTTTSERSSGVIGAHSRKPAYSLSTAGPETRTEQVGPCDEVASERAAEVLLDDVGVAVLDALESVRDVEAIADLVRPGRHEIEFGRVGEPADE